MPTQNPSAIKAMHRAAAVLCLLAVIVAPAKPAAAEEGGPSATLLLSTGTTVAGETLHYPTGAPARVTATIVTFMPGARTPLHKHGVPLFAYVLEGEITVDYGDRGKRTYHQGDALMEAMDVAHFGADTAARPVRLLVVYMGAEGVADTLPVK